MMTTRWVLLVMTAAACGGSNSGSKFVGSWAYASDAQVSVTCGSSVSSSPLGTVVETFVESGDELVKHDSQGCAGLEFSVDGEVASLDGAGQSCMIPANGSTPAATFAPSAYVFTLGADGTMTATVTASYTLAGSPACMVEGTNTLKAQ